MKTEAEMTGRRGEKGTEVSYSVYKCEPPIFLKDKTHEFNFEYFDIKFLLIIIFAQYVTAMKYFLC